MCLYIECKNVYNILDMSCIDEMLNVINDCQRI